MGETPCEGEKTKGGAPHGRGARANLQGCKVWPGTPFVSRQAVGVLSLVVTAGNIVMPYGYPIRRLATKYLYIQLTSNNFCSRINSRSYFFPKKNTEQVPAPTWEPIVAPTSEIIKSLQPNLFSINLFNSKAPSKSLE